MGNEKDIFSVDDSQIYISANVLLLMLSSLWFPFLWGMMNCLLSSRPNCGLDSLIENWKI